MKLALENIKNKELKNKNKELENDVRYKLNQIQSLNSRLQDILYSKRFKTADKIGNLLNKIKYIIKGGK